MKQAAAVALGTLALLASACGGGDSTSKPAPTPPAATRAAPERPATPAQTSQTSPAATPVPTGSTSITMAEKVFTTRCAPCHGASGKGDGAAAAALNPKPRDYSDKAWQATITDEAIAKAIVSGGPSVGLSALMPPNPDLANKPEVVNALVAKIRGFAK